MNEPLPTPRAALIRRACHEYLQRLEERRLDVRDAEGYRRKPETPAWGEAAARLSTEILPEEHWQ
jgi:uroporphyrinogen-III synthase